jgi:hypothetical protein
VSLVYLARSARIDVFLDGIVHTFPAKVSLRCKCPGCWR